MDSASAARSEIAVECVAQTVDDGRVSTGASNAAAGTEYAADLAALGLAAVSFSMIDAMINASSGVAYGNRGAHQARRARAPRSARWPATVRRNARSFLETVRVRKEAASA